MTDSLLHLLQKNRDMRALFFVRKSRLFPVRCIFATHRRKIKNENKICYANSGSAILRTFFFVRKSKFFPARCISNPEFAVEDAFAGVF